MPSESSELLFMSAKDLLALYTERAISPVEVVHQFLERIRDTEELNAFVDVHGDSAISAARRAEDALAAGMHLGPLSGVTVAIKDLAGHISGTRDTSGSRLYANSVSTQTAHHVQRLQAAGAIVLGKTNTSEFGHKATTDNLLFGATHNPFRFGYNSGGSSGGSAAAIAAGLTTLADGGDAAGSIRVPAAFCGVYGLKPTFGMIASPSRPNAFRSHSPFTHKGILTRTVGDAELMLSVLAGPNTRDPFSLPNIRIHTRYRSSRRRYPMRIGFSPDFGSFPVQTDVRGMAEEVVLNLGSRDEVVVEVIKKSPPVDHRELEEICRTALAVRLAWQGETLRRTGVDISSTDVGSDVRQLMEEGRSVTAIQMQQADVVRTQFLDWIEDVFVSCHIIITPTTCIPPFPNGAARGSTVGPAQIGAESVDPLFGWALAYPLNLTGHPTASVPMGLLDGLPVGLQVIGQRYRDMDVLECSYLLEEIHPWQHQYRRFLPGMLDGDGYYPHERQRGASGGDQTNVPHFS